MEWNVGEVAGLLAAHCLNDGLTPHQVQADDALLTQFQARLYAEGIEIRWPDGSMETFPGGEVNSEVFLARGEGEKVR